MSRHISVSVGSMMSSMPPVNTMELVKGDQQHCIVEAIYVSLESRARCFWPTLSLLIGEVQIGKSFPLGYGSNNFAWKPKTRRSMSSGSSLKLTWKPMPSPKGIIQLTLSDAEIAAVLEKDAHAAPAYGGQMTFVNQSTNNGHGVFNKIAGNQSYYSNNYYINLLDCRPDGDKLRASNGGSATPQSIVTRIADWTSHDAALSTSSLMRKTGREGCTALSSKDNPTPACSSVAFYGRAGHAGKIYERQIRDYSQGYGFNCR
ncbi:hypothetical protein EYR38_009815 [Pleurotus pulmonarius]|nr:hypothetical protein EYR38_009815 [Pleurotus pulmonarius]